MTAPADFSSSVASSEVNAAARQVGVVYAKALWAASKKANQLDEVAEDFDAVMEVIDSHPAWVGLSRSGMIPNDQRAEIYRKAFDGKASPLFVNFLRTVARHGRAQMLRAIHRAFREIYDEHKGRVRVEVTTPTKLDDGVSKRLSDALQGVLGMTPIFEPRIEPSLIGGVTLRVKDTVYDASVAKQLEEIRTQMIDRTVHEIQSRRDRFRSAEGN